MVYERGEKRQGSVVLLYELYKGRVVLLFERMSQSHLGLRKNHRPRYEVGKDRPVLGGRPFPGDLDQVGAQVEECP